jgi:hypothetical protein
VFTAAFEGEAGGRMKKRIPLTGDLLKVALAYYRATQRK